MAILSILLLVIFIVGCFLLVLMVLVQDDQGEGLGGIFGGGSSTPFGSRSGNVLTKFTTILAATFFICALGLTWVNRATDGGDILGTLHRQTSERAEIIEWWNAPGTTTIDRIEE